MWISLPRYEMVFHKFYESFNRDLSFYKGIIASTWSYLSQSIIKQSNIPQDSLHFHYHMSHTCQSSIDMHLALTSLCCTRSCLTPNGRFPFLWSSLSNNTRNHNNLHHQKVITQSCNRPRHIIISFKSYGYLTHSSPRYTLPSQIFS